MARKNVDVEYVRTAANAMLAVPDDKLFMIYRDGAAQQEQVTPAQAFRQAVAHLLEGVLFYSGNYHGYGYQPGQITTDDSYTLVIGDDTRRVYH